jgi:hypothetical protein
MFPLKFAVRSEVYGVKHWFEIVCKIIHALKKLFEINEFFIQLFEGKKNTM